MSGVTSIEWTERRDAIDALDPVDLAYLAGLIDGEGAIYATHNSQHGGTMYPVLAVAMTHYNVLAWMASRLGVNPPRVHNMTAVRRNPTNRTQWIVAMHGTKAQRMCRRLIPFLRVKALQAQIVADFPCDSRRGPGAFLSAAVRRKRERLAAELAELNKRLPDPNDVLGPDGHWYDADPGGLSLIGVPVDMMSEVMWEGVEPGRRPRR